MDLFLIFGISLIISSIMLCGRLRKDAFILGATLIVLYVGESFLRQGIISPEYAVPEYTVWKPLLILFPVGLSIIFIVFVLWNHRILQRVPKKIKKINVW